MSIPVEAIHPSVYILEEIEARGWTLDDLALAMGADDFQVNRLALDFYIEIGAETRNMRIGDRSAALLAKAFGTSTEFRLNLERAWLKALSSPLPTKDGAE